MHRATTLFTSLLMLATGLVTTGLATTSRATAQDGTAVFEVTFQSTWSKATHPVDFPSNPHYSPLIGATHDAATSFWKVGGIATNGIESMAETGSTTTLANEINAAIKTGGAKTLILGSGLGSPASAMLRFTADASHTQFTMVSMLAPSPDWFVGVSGVDLMKNGRWIDKMTFPATLWDAGSDSGTTYTAANQNTNPKEKIDVVSTSGGPFKGYSTTLGMWTLRRVASTEVFGCGVNPKGSMSVVSGEPLIGQSVTFAVHDPGNSMPSGSTAFLLFSPNSSANFPCGIKIPGFGMSKPGAAGEYLLGQALLLTLPGGKWTGSPVSFALSIPNDAKLIGIHASVQGGLASAQRLGLADAVEVYVGM